MVTTTRSPARRPGGPREPHRGHHGDVRRWRCSRAVETRIAPVVRPRPSARSRGRHAPRPDRRPAAPPSPPAAPHSNGEPPIRRLRDRAVAVSVHRLDHFLPAGTSVTPLARTPEPTAPVVSVIELPLVIPGDQLVATTALHRSRCHNWRQTSTHRLVGHPVPLRRVRPSRSAPNWLHRARSRTVSRNRPDGERNSRAGLIGLLSIQKTSWIKGLRHVVLSCRSPDAEDLATRSTKHGIGWCVQHLADGAGRSRA